MAFTWNNITTGSIIDYDDYFEIKQNIDTVADRLPGSPGDYSWNNTPSAGTTFYAVEIQELRNATDWLDDNNVCNIDNSSYDYEVDSDWDGTYDNDQKTGVEDVYDYSEDGPYDYQEDGYKDLTYEGTYNSGYENDDNGTYDDADNGTAYSSERSAVT